MDIQNSNNMLISNTIELQKEMAENAKTFNPCADDDDYEKFDPFMDQCVLLAGNIKTKLNEHKFNEDKNRVIVKILVQTFMQLLVNFCAVMNDVKKQLFTQGKRRIKVRCTKSNGESIQDEEAGVMVEHIIQNGQLDELFARNNKSLLNQLLETRPIILRIDRDVKNINQITNDMQLFVY